MYTQLIRFDPDMNAVPELAEWWQISPDVLTWTFKLRQGVKFHDGQELTSADVKFTFDGLVEKSPGKTDFLTVDKIEPVGKYTIKFVTKEPFAGLPASRGSFWGFIISEAGIEKYGDLNKSALDALLDEGRRTMDPKRRKEIYDRAQIMILENVPHLWLYSADTIDFTQTSVKGFRQHPTTMLYGFEGAWLDKA